MGFKDSLKEISSRAFGGFTGRMLMFAIGNDDKTIVPVSVRDFAGGGASAAASAVGSVADYPPQQINVGAEQGLTVPDGATHALVSVAQGQVRAGLHTTENGMVLQYGDTFTLTGTQLNSFRLIYFGAGVDALVRVDYWKEGPL